MSKKSLEDKNKAENPDIEKEKQPEENADQKSLESSEDGNFEQVFDFGFWKKDLRIQCGLRSKMAFAQIIQTFDVTCRS